MAAPTFRRFGKTEQPLPTVTEQATSRPQAQTPAQSSGGKPNKFGGNCTECGTHVAAESGLLAGKVNGKWAVKHLPGECGSAPSYEAEATVTERQVNTVAGATLYDGTYTLSKADGHRTFRLRTQKVDDDFMPGAQIAQYLNGADNEGDYTSFGSVKNGRIAVWRRHQGNESLVADAQAFMSDPHGDDVVAAVACYACGRKLTVPASVHNGLGPECAKNGR